MKSNKPQIDSEYEPNTNYVYIFHVDDLNLDFAQLLINKYNG